MFEVDLTGARVVFTTRLGGSSKGPYASRNLGVLTEDDASIVQHNLSRTKSEFELESLQLLRQVHGSVIERVGAATHGTLPIADGALVTERHSPVLITGADCPAVVLATPSKLVSLHCGWRSVAGGIIEAAADQLAGEQFTAALGPGICSDHFEVGDEVVAAMGVHGPNFASGRQFDLPGMIRHRLELAGATRVHHVERCTHCEPDLFFSHRRDNGVTGRQGAIAWRI